MTADLPSLSDSVVAITGGSSGIGLSTARALVNTGARVALTARAVERLEALAREFGSHRALVVPGDIRDPEVSKNLVQQAVQRWGRLDAIVANAGVGYYGGILEPRDHEVVEMVSTNFLGTVWTVRAAVQSFRERGTKGDIILVSSAAGFRGGPREGVYAGTKHAQVGLAGSLDRELRAEGIRVTLVCPGGTDTNFAIGHGREVSDPRLGSYLSPDEVAHVIVTALAQPRSMRTTVWQVWSSAQDS